MSTSLTMILVLSTLLKGALIIFGAALIVGVIVGFMLIRFLVREFKGGKTELKEHKNDT
jgi:uncharacterized membrane-anchored protein YhcB (DUF1043 family)